MSAVLSSNTPTTRRQRVLVAGAVVAVAAGASVVGLAPTARASSSDNYTVLGHLNALRAAHGLHGLALSGDLNAIAAGHSAAMERAESLFHNPNLTSQVTNWRVVGENVGMGPTAAAIDTAFDHSPEHYANEVNPAYTQVGIGTARDNRGYLYITVDFRDPMNAPVAPARPVSHPAPRPVHTTPRPAVVTHPRTPSATVHHTASAPHVTAPVRTPAAKPVAPRRPAAVKPVATTESTALAHLNSMMAELAGPIATALAISRVIATVAAG